MVSGLVFECGNDILRAGVDTAPLGNVVGSVEGTELNYQSKTLPKRDVAYRAWVQRSLCHSFPVPLTCSCPSRSPTNLRV